MKKPHTSEKESSNKPLTKEEVNKHPDKHIDQDFEGYPHSPASEDTINPKTEKDNVNANLVKKHKSPSASDEKHNNIDEENSDGSANAFESSENDTVLREELNDDKKKRSNY
jgi:hypothetical protein